MILKGRAHPNEWMGEEFGAMMVAHPLQVLKELARRQRSRDGVDPQFVFTYLTGVREGHPMETGNLGVILDDMEMTNGMHPGHGPRGILDEYAGYHFQPKAARASNIDAARKFVDYADSAQKTDVYPVVLCGTPGTTEYQGFLEVALLDAA